MWKTKEIGFWNYLKENEAAQFLVFRQLEIIRVPALYENLVCTTSVFDCRGSNGFRNTIICDEAGKPCYKSWSQGAFVNVKTGRLLRVPQEIIAGMSMSPRLDMEYCSRKILIPQGSEIELPEVTVQRNDIDYNNHMNNAQYIRLALEFLPAGFEIASMRVEYKQAARCGSQLKPAMIEDGNSLYIILRESGATCCVLEFTRAASANSTGWYAW